MRTEEAVPALLITLIATRRVRFVLSSPYRTSLNCPLPSSVCTPGARVSQQVRRRVAVEVGRRR